MGQATIFNGQKIKTLKDTLTLNGKSDIISSTVDPTASAVDAPIGSLLINQTSGKLYRKLDAGSSVNWEEVGAGVGGINYILNPSAEVNTTGWATYADAAGTAPVDGTGGSPNVTWTRSTTSPLRGVADFNFAKDAANRQGQGVSYDFTIDEADKAKVLTVSFDYEVLSGTYADGDLTVYLIADPTGTPVVIQPAGYTVQAATVGTTMRQVATFQTQATGTSYRLCFHVASTSAAAYTLAIDNVVVGPQQTVQGAAISDWVSYTPTPQGFTASAIEGKWRRVGDSVEVKARAVMSGTTGGAYSISAPFVADSTKFPASLPNNFYGTGGYYDLSANQGYIGTSFVTSGASPVIGVYGPAGSQWQVSTVPVAFGVGDIFTVDITYPVQGWSSNTVMSSDTDTRVVAARAFVNSPQTVLNGATDVIVFDGTSFDTHGAMEGSGATRGYRVKVSGKYRVSSGLFSLTFGGVNWSGLQIWKNGVEYSRVESAAGASRKSILITDEVDCVAGDLIQIKLDNFSGASVVIQTGNPSYLTVERASGPATIAASETVAMSGYTTASQSIPNGGSFVVFGSKNYDTHGILNTSTGVATIPVSGTFLIQTICDFSSSSTAGIRALDIYKGASRITSGIVVSANIGATTTRVATSIVTKLVAGDTISNYVFQNSGVAVPLSSSATENIFTITRLGN